MESVASEKGPEAGTRGAALGLDLTGLGEGRRSLGFSIAGLSPCMANSSLDISADDDPGEDGVPDEAVREERGDAGPGEAWLGVGPEGGGDDDVAVKGAEEASRDISMGAMMVTGEAEAGPGEDGAEALARHPTRRMICRIAKAGRCAFIGCIMYYSRGLEKGGCVWEVSTGSSRLSRAVTASR